MLEKLEDKFKKELDDTEKEELNAKHNFEMQVRSVLATAVDASYAVWECLWCLQEF